MTALIWMLVLLPGAGATLATFKAGEGRLPTQLACLFGLGYAVVVAWSILLVLVNALNPLSFFSGLVVITTALLFVGLRRSGLRERRDALLADFHGDRWSMAVGSVAVAITAVATLRRLSPLLNFGFANPFRYWADGIEIASIGSVPSQILQWGSLFTPAASKIGFNSFNAAFSFLSDDPLALMEPLLGVCLVGSLLAGWALGRELGLRYLAPLLVVVSGAPFFAHSLAVSPQDSYRADSFGRLVLIVGMALAINALRNKDRVWVATAAGVAIGAAGTTHLIPTSVGLGLLSGYTLIFLVMQREVRNVMRVAVIVSGVFVLFMLSVFGGGRAAFESVDPRERIDTRSGTFDPTLYLATGRIHQGDWQPRSRSELNNGWYHLPGDIFRDFVGSSISSDEVDVSTSWGILVAAGVVAMTLLFVAPKDLRPIGPAAFAVWVSLLLIAIVMSSMYETHVPASFVQRRLWSYDTFMLLLIGTTGLEVVIHRLQAIRDWMPIAAGALAVLFVAVSTLPSAPPPQILRQGVDSLRAMNWVSENLPCDARILASERSGGIFQALTGRVAVTEGAAPFLRPAVMGEVVELLLDARSFFEAPGRRLDVLEKHAADYVMASKKKYVLNRRPPLLGTPDLSLIAGAEQLEMVYSDDLIDVYHAPDVDTSDRPRPRDHAGYACRTEPLPVPSL